ncbi:hypothetical protein ZWY2020_022228 [Hordeum vulgare]|nr:hypothetical protein ZWY2020_022228 [Hordeum vulgare]
MLPPQSSPSPHSRLLLVRFASLSRSPRMAHGVFLAISRRTPPGVPPPPCGGGPCPLLASREPRPRLGSVDRRTHHSNPLRRRGRRMPDTAATAPASIEARPRAAATLHITMRATADGRGLGGWTRLEAPWMPGKLRRRAAGGGGEVEVEREARALRRWRCGSPR